MRVLDLALVIAHSNQVEDALDGAARDQHQLARGVSLGRLERSLAANIIKACEPAGQNFHPSRLYTPLYAFSRSVEAPLPHEGWDPGGYLSRAVQCSRLVRTTTAGFDYAARVIHHAAGDEIVPIQHSLGRAWLPDMPTRESRHYQNWLTDEDAAEIARLTSASFTATLPKRVRDAMFFFEYAVYIPHTNVRWPVLATASEALVKVYGETVQDARRARRPRRAGSTEVFVKRMRKLSELISYPAEEQDLTRCYEERSRLVHTGMFDAVVLGSAEHDGSDPSGFTAERRHLFGMHEEILRRSLKRCVLDADFAGMFADDRSVVENFPLR